MKPELTKLENARKGYNFYKDGKWLFVSLAQALAATLIAGLLFVFNDEKIPNYSMLGMLGVVFILFLVFGVLNSVKLLLAKTRYQQLHIEELEEQLQKRETAQ